MKVIAGAGTAEQDWQAWGGLGQLPQLAAELVGDRPLIVAPHPDDEILGAGGLLAIAGGEVAAVTDGEASHPGSVAVEPADLVLLRRRETTAALAALHRPATRVHRLGHPDGGIDEDRLAGELAGLLAEPAPAAGTRSCIATWRHDGHPDHEAVGRAAARACAATGCRLVEYPVWMWHWADPATPDIPWARAFRLSLPASVRALKRAAMAAFTSQIHPLGPEPADAAILPPHVLARFARAEETYFL